MSNRCGNLDKGNTGMINQIFVYGTLKCGESNHRLIADKYVEVRPAVTYGMLFDLGAYPAAWLRGNRHIYGEVFQFENVESILQVLDKLEGVPTLYRRVCIPVLDPETLDVDGTEAWAYEYNRILGKDLLIPAGVWSGRQ